MASARLLVLASLVAAVAGGLWIATAETDAFAQGQYVRPAPSPPVATPTPRSPPPRIVTPQIVPNPLRNAPGRLESGTEQDKPATGPQKSRPRQSQPVSTERSTTPQTTRSSQTTQQAPRAVLPADAPLPRPRPAEVAAPHPPPQARPQPFAFDPPLREPDVVLVALLGGTDQGMAQTLATEHGLTVLSQASLALVDLDIYRLRIHDGRPIEDVLAAIELDGRVALSGPNLIFAPQDASAGASARQYAAARLELDEAHGWATGREVRVAVIDTGVDLDHEALHDAGIRTATVFDAEAPTPGAHGTEIAGAMVAQGMLRGVSPAIDLVAIEAFRSPRRDAQAEATIFGIAQALDLAHDADVQIVNMSFAGGRDALLALMLDALDERGIVLVAAAGNGGPEAPPAFPGDHGRTIAVTATDISDELYRGANLGEYVSIAAPGVDVIAATVEGRYRMVTGTSIATAHVAGAVALLLERRPDLSPAEIQALLAETAIDLGPPGPDPKFGAGLIHPVAALTGSSERVATPVEVGAGN